MKGKPRDDVCCLSCCGKLKNYPHKYLLLFTTRLHPANNAILPPQTRFELFFPRLPQLLWCVGGFITCFLSLFSNHFFVFASSETYFKNVNINYIHAHTHTYIHIQTALHSHFGGRMFSCPRPVLYPLHPYNDNSK